MASAGPNYATTAVSDSSLSGNAWNNPGNATASDNSYATANSNGTQYLKATGFGFSIPTGATIDGIVVEWERKTSASGVTDKAVRIVKGGTVGSTDKSAAGNWPTTDAFASYGNSSDLWGETWTAADINAASFGAAIATQSTFVRTASVDAVRITVYYTDVSAITENATATESSDAAATVDDGVTESTTASETGDAASALAADIAEAAAATESSDSSLGPKQGDITEPATATESSDAVASSTDGITESASATDTPSASATANAGITETASATESSSASVIVYASASESATATESSDGIAVGQLYREDATGFLVVKSGAGAGYTALAAPTTAAAWRVLDIYGSTSAWHPSDDAPATESAAPFDPNYAASNDQNGSAISAPTIASDGTAVDHTISTDGTANMSFEWTWSGTESTIDGFYVFLYQSTSSAAYTFGTSPAAEKVYVVPASKRAHLVYGVPANQYYTWGVQAFRNVAPNVAGSPTIKSTLVKPSLAAENPYRPSSSVAFSGDLTGTINGSAPGAYANLDLLTSSNIDSYMSNSTLGTLKLALNALAVLQGASGSVSTQYNTWLTTSTWNIPAVSDAVLRGKFLLLLWCQWPEQGSSYYAARRIKRGSTVIATAEDYIVSGQTGGKSQVIAWIDNDVPATAAFTYTVETFQLYNGSSFNINSSFAIIELKRS